MTRPHPLLRLARAALACLALAASAAALAQPVVARVNGAPITQEALDGRYQEVLRERNLHVARMQNPAQARELKQEALDRLVREELFWQQAQAERLVVSDEEVGRAVAATAAQYKTRDAFELQLLRQGFSDATYGAYVRRLLSADRYADRVVVAEVKVSDEDVAVFYRANRRLFAQPERLRLRRIAIVKGPPADDAQRRAARERIDALRAELVRGSDFDRLARAHSDDPTRQWGGELDPVAPEELPDWMRAAIAALAPGGLSPVAETDAAFYLVKLEQRVPATDVSMDEARAGIRAQLTTSRGLEALERKARELRAAAKVEMLMAP